MTKKQLQGAYNRYKDCDYYSVDDFYKKLYKQRFDTRKK